MKVFYLAIALTGAALFIGDAQANDEFIASCEAYAEANASDIDCSCLNAAAEADPTLYEEFAKVSVPEDAANMSEAAQGVVAQCSAE